MTSRPPVGPQRPPQRSSSETGTLQKPAPHRQLSQQYVSSPAGGKPDNFVDLTVEDSESVRHGSSGIPGSRLRLELSEDSNESALFLQSPRPIEIVPNSQSARGRPRLRFDADLSQLRGTGESSLLSSFSGVVDISSQTSLPLPRRPIRIAATVARVQRVPPAKVLKPANVVKKDVRPRPYVLGVPSAAPHYLPNAHADFFPWTGDQSEDQFTDDVIRQGFFDKSQATQNETTSARLSILPALKHKSSLQTLSSLYANILKQRRTHSQIVTPSTFKPPPRVTLTDMKRQTWLRDLANPRVPLRRLSRTIPHGIRGKVLLEQCLSKMISTSRAVWFAKCVGANEIRAFKRKGVTGTFAMGGEAKWIRDWTVFVEQFVESIVAGCGDDEWKPKILYAIRLAAHLYSEHLLDREHYMDWLSVSMESSPLAKVPIWLLITQVYWNDLLKSRKYGCRLVAAICDHLRLAQENPDRDILAPLVERLTVLLKGLMETNAESFVSPKLWEKYKATLSSYIFSDQQDQSPSYQLIDQRNERLATPCLENESNPSRLVIVLLDSTFSHPFATTMPSECRKIMADLSCLAQTVLAWSTSSHRPGLTKVYVGVRLLRTYSRSGLDVNEAILEFIGSGPDGPGLCKASLYHLVGELTRSGHFLMSKYLQWLIARGGVRVAADLTENGSCATRLLAELPTVDIPDSVRRLRRTLLGRAGFSVDHELQEISAQITTVDSLLSGPGEKTETALIAGEFLSTESIIARRPACSRAIKSDIGVWVRTRITSKVKGPESTDSWKEDKTSGAKTAITHVEFNLMRAVLEDIGDLSMLADILKIVKHSDNLKILASAADTLNCHLEEFAAIGALNDIFEKILTRLRSVAEDGEIINLLAALSQVAQRLPGSESLALHLSQELLRRNRKTAADACSPVSDHMVDVLQSSDLEFSDEIDKLLASGTSMDKATLEPIFNIIMSRIEASWTKPTFQYQNCARLSVRLRNFDTKHFDSLMTVWLKKVIDTSDRPNLLHALGPLISVKSVEFREVIETGGALVESNLAGMNKSAATKTAIDVLHLIFGAPCESDFLSSDDAYRFRISRLRLRRDYSTEVICVIRRAIESGASSVGDEQIHLASICHGEHMRNFLRQTVLQNFDSVVEGLVLPLAKSSCRETRGQLGQIIGQLLSPELDERVTEQSLAYRIEYTIRLADDLTLPFCQLELQLMFAGDVRIWSNDENDGTGCLKAFERAVDSAIERNNGSWTSIIPALDIEIARHLCQRAERLLLQLLPSHKTEDLYSSAPLGNGDIARRLLLVIQATTYSLESNRSQNLALQTVEKLNDIWRIASRGGTPSRSSVIGMWLPLLLDFITLHVNTFKSNKNSTEIRSRILLILSALLLELQSNTDFSVTLSQRVFDISLSIVDDLPEDARLNCVRFLRDKTTDFRICYIFGYSPLPMEWLQLSQNGKLMPFPLRRWEMLSEPTPNVGKNDTSLSLTLFKARSL